MNQLNVRTPWAPRKPERGNQVHPRNDGSGTVCLGRPGTDHDTVVVIDNPQFNNQGPKVTTLRIKGSVHKVLGQNGL